MCIWKDLRGLRKFQLLYGRKWKTYHTQLNWRLPKALPLFTLMGSRECMHFTMSFVYSIDDIVLFVTIINQTCKYVSSLLRCICSSVEKTSSTVTEIIVNPWVWKLTWRLRKVYLICFSTRIKRKMTGKHFRFGRKYPTFDIPPLIHLLNIL